MLLVKLDHEIPGRDRGEDYKYVKPSSQNTSHWVEHLIGTQLMVQKSNQKTTGWMVFSTRRKYWYNWCRISEPS